MYISPPKKRRFILDYKRAEKYAGYNKDVMNIGGPGGLEVAEFMAGKLSLSAGKKLIDIGFCQGFQTCFLAKEYGVDIVAIDPGGELVGIPYGIEPLMENARKYGVENKIIGIKTSVPNTLLPNNFFDFAYTTNCLEMIRGFDGSEAYLAALKEIYRILKPGGLLGLAEPMCADIPIPTDIAEKCKEYSFDTSFATEKETVNAVAEAGFKIREHGLCDEAYEWWQDHVSNHDPDDEYRVAVEKMNDSGWLTFGYIIAVKE